MPTLRGLRELKSAPAEPVSKVAERPGWSPWHGAAFSGGLAVAAISLLLCALNGWYLMGAHHFSVDRTDDVAGAASGELDTFSPEQLLDEWNEIRAEGLTHVHTPIWVAAKESAVVYRWRTIAFGGLGAIALAVAIAAALFGRGR